MTSPFGVQLNADLDPSCVVEELGGNKFKILPPSPHPSFTTYLAEAHPAFGVVWLKGIGPIVEGDRYGGGVKAQHEKVSSQLQKRYGDPQKVDIWDTNGIWDQPNDWIASIEQNERSFFHVWEQGKQHLLPEDVQMLFLGLVTYSSYDAAIAVEYISSKMSAAEAATDDELAELF